MRSDEIMWAYNPIKKFIQGPSQEVRGHFSNEILFRCVHPVYIECWFIIFVLTMFDILLLESEVWIMQILYQLLSIKCVSHEAKKFMCLQLDGFEDVSSLQLHLAWTFSDS